jgi:prefoldin alpha subunit
MSAMTVSNEREIQPMQLSLEQLNTLKQQHEEELQELQRQLEALNGAKTRFLSSRNTLDDISTSSSGDTLLVPLNSSLYVPGKIIEPEKVK